MLVILSDTTGLSGLKDFVQFHEKKIFFMFSCQAYIFMAVYIVSLKAKLALVNRSCSHKQ